MAWFALGYLITWSQNGRVILETWTESNFTPNSHSFQALYYLATDIRSPDIPALEFRHDTHWLEGRTEWRTEIVGPYGISDCPSTGPLPFHGGQHHRLIAINGSTSYILATSIFRVISHRFVTLPSPSLGTGFAESVIDSYGLRCVGLSFSCSILNLRSTPKTYNNFTNSVNWS